MNIITIDFETYYDPVFSLSKLTTEEYVRSEQFEIIGVSVAVNDEGPVWFSGALAETKAWLEQFDWANSFALAHNTMFDGAILSWVLGIKPKGWLDTLCMARALHGLSVGNSLKSLAEMYNIGEKGTEVINAIGKRRVDFTPTELARYGAYCCNDVALTRTLFHIFMMPGLGQNFPKIELKVIDTTLRMYLEPVLELNLPVLEAHMERTKERKAQLMAMIEEDRDTLMSNNKFANLLMSLGVDPPTKPNAKGINTWAFAKTDKGFTELLEHSDPRVQALVAARLGVKSTLEETRTQRFIDIAQRGKLPVPIRYYAAHTGRFGGDDKINLQNLPSRGNNANRLKAAIIPPEGYVIIDADSSQIEARTVAWLAGQQDLVDAFEQGRDVYRLTASSIFNKPPEEISTEERFFAKTVVLGCGYGMGAVKLQTQLKASNVEIGLKECSHMIDVYRTQYPEIPRLWSNAGKCLRHLINKQSGPFDVQGLLTLDPDKQGFRLPNNLYLSYEGLTFDQDQFTYLTRRGMYSKIYGGKVVENLCQAVARCVITEQMLRVAKRYRVALTVHDSIVVIAPKAEALEAAKYVQECMRWRPAWAATLPLNCEVKIGSCYGAKDLGELK